MSQNFVTNEELDKRLAGFERLGTSQTVCGELEDTIKKSVRVSIENSHVELKALVEDRAGELFNKLDSHIKKYMDNLSLQIQEATQKSLSSGIEKAKRDIDLDLNVAIKAKIEEPFSQLTYLQKSFESRIEEVFEAKLKNFETRFKNEMKNFEIEWSDKTSEMISTSNEHLKDSLANQSHSFIHSHILNIRKVVEELKSDLSKEMSKKLVDKQAIEEKLKEIQDELHKKAQSVIDFNIAQARHNMEQSARAELEEGIKTAAGKIISGLT